MQDLEKIAAKALELDGSYTDLLTDTVHMGRITVPPYQVSVLEKSR